MRHSARSRLPARPGFLAPLGLLASLILLAGCGFHPLYQGGPQAPQARMQNIFVAVIPGRPGQELRQELQQRLAGSSEAQPDGYILRVAYGQSNEAIAIHGDNTSSRNRVIGRANWTLVTVPPDPSVPPTTLASGSANSVDGFNDINTQFFATELAYETTSQRIAGNLADAISNQIGIWFAGHPQTTSGPQEAAAPARPTFGPANAGFLAPQNIPGDSGQSIQQPLGPDGMPAAATGRSSLGSQ